MKTIGFIDFYISEWHANNYPKWIKEAGNGEFVIKYVWAEQDVSPVDGRTTDEWCEAFGCERCATIAELCEKSDYIMILAPSNPEKHLAYAEEALKCGKNTYIDKTFAPDYPTAQKIFDIAEKYGTKFFSSSALRYGTELDAYMGATDIITTGSGKSVEEYIIHQIEMVVKTVAAKPKAVFMDKTEDSTNFYVLFEGGKKAKLCFCQKGFAVEANGVNTPVCSEFFKLLIADILRFYEEGTPSFDVSQTLDVMKIRGAIIEVMKNGGWIEL
jgi:hypothetical protein